MSATRYLADTAPVWFSVDAVGSEALSGRALVPRTPWVASGLSLRIFGSPKPRVREEAPGTDLPARCPERHIQSDETFCLGLRYIDVCSSGDALQWWEQLRQFLICQGVAERTRIWPPGHALDHGDAGRGGEGSLIYFKRIRERTEANYLSELLACGEDDFHKDLIGQIWRNSDILCLKFGWVKKAIIATALSVVPFIIFLATTAAIHDRIPLFKG